MIRIRDYKSQYDSTIKELYMVYEQMEEAEKSIGFRNLMSYAEYLECRR